MRDANDALRGWLDSNPWIWHRRDDWRFIALSEELEKLRQHLSLWFEKYEALFAPDERRTLVHLADESDHGGDEYRFPAGVESAVTAAIEAAARR